MFVLCKHVSGSRSYGLDIEGSDNDIRGIYLENREEITTPFFLTNGVIKIDDSEDAQLYSLNKFFAMLNKGAFSAFETLAVDLKHVKEMRIHYMILRANMYEFTTDKIVRSLFGAVNQSLKTIGGYRYYSVLNPVAYSKDIYQACRLVTTNLHLARTGEFIPSIPSEIETMMKIRQERKASILAEFVPVIKEKQELVRSLIDEQRLHESLNREFNKQLAIDLIIQIQNNLWFGKPMTANSKLSGQLNIDVTNTHIEGALK